MTKRILLSVAAGLSMLAGSALAQQPTPQPQGGAQGTSGAQGQIQPGGTNVQGQGTIQGQVQPGTNLQGQVQPGVNAQGQMQPGVNVQGQLQPGMNAQGQFGTTGMYGQGFYPGYSTSYYPSTSYYRGRYFGGNAYPYSSFNGRRAFINSYGASTTWDGYGWRRPWVRRWARHYAY